MNKSQKGFGVIELVLIIVVVGILGATGWYAIHTKHQTDQILSQSEKTSQSTPSTPSSQKYLTIKEWGVRAKYSSTLTLEYTLDNKSLPEAANFNSVQLKASNPGCTDGIDGGGVITRYSPSSHVYGEDGSDLGTATQYFANYDNSTPGNKYSHVGNYYYQYVHPQSACGSNFDLMTQTDDAVNALVQNLEALPAQ